MNLVEKAGTGIRRMREAMGGYKLELPLIETNNNWFTIIFKRPEESYEERVFGKTREKPRRKTRERILKFMRENKEITMAELSEKVGISEKGIEWQINELKKEGIIKRTGGRKGGYWEILEKEGENE